MLFHCISYLMKPIKWNNGLKKRTLTYTQKETWIFCSKRWVKLKNIPAYVVAVVSQTRKIQCDINLLQLLRVWKCSFKEQKSLLSLLALEGDCRNSRLGLKHFSKEKKMIDLKIDVKNLLVIL